MRPHRRRVLLTLGWCVAAVFATAGVSSAAGEQLTLSVRAREAGIEASATLRDSRGRALAGAEITVQRRTVFGWLEVATLTTAADGTARVGFPVPGGSRLEVRAVAALEERSVSKTVQLDLGTMSVPRTRPGEGELRALSPQPGFVSPYPPGRLLLTLIPILAGVWMTYAVVVYQLYAIAHNR